VENEISDEAQRAAFLEAVAAGHLDTCTVNDPREVELFLRLGPVFVWALGNALRSLLQQTDDMQLPSTIATPSVALSAMPG
jgi:hypothetical protein